MPAADGRAQRRLSLVTPGEELRGAGPPAFERLARTAKVGSKEHVALINLSLTFAREGLRVTVPPSGRVHLTTVLESLSHWLRLTLDQRNSAGAQQEFRAQRAQAFAATAAIEQLTLAALTKAGALTDGRPATALSDHAQLTVKRYCRLGAHHATAAVCHAVDALTEPEVALQVPGDVAGALAYQNAALGSARHTPFQKAAIEQAEWETSRSGNPGELGPLSLLIFHEYLGARWRAHADLQRERLWGFIAWALAGRSSAPPPGRADNV